MRIGTPPEIRLLEAAKETLELVDYDDRAGRAVDTIRHARNRFPTSDEGDTISLRWMGNTDADVEDIYKSADERVRHCNIDLEFDFSVRPEDSEEDPTGWLDITLVAAATLEALRDENGPLRQLCDWIIDRDDDPDDDSKPDEGRLVKRISVVYRCRTDDPNHLLALGA